MIYYLRQADLNVSTVSVDTEPAELVFNDIFLFISVQKWKEPPVKTHHGSCNYAFFFLLYVLVPCIFQGSTPGIRVPPIFMALIKALKVFSPASHFFFFSSPSCVFQLLGYCFATMSVLKQGDTTSAWTMAANWGGGVASCQE